MFDDDAYPQEEARDVRFVRPALHRANTAHSIKKGVRRQGSMMRMTTRSDMHDAVAWMEGTQEAEEDVERGQTAAQLATQQDFDDEAEQEQPALEAPTGLRGSRAEQAARPALLVTSLLFGALCMLTLQCGLVSDALGSAHGQRFTLFFASLYAATLVDLAYVALHNPGETDQDEPYPPRRSHKSWQFGRPIRRFDHYCRWVANCIGLLNHREFMFMLVLFTAVAVLGGAVDVMLLCLFAQDVAWVFLAVVALHLAYSAVFGRYVVSLLRLHAGFVSRNELANEWKNDEFYVVRDEETGEKAWVGDLEVEEFNERFDDFEYDQTRNLFDAGAAANCWAFWCTARHGEDQRGEF